MNSADIKTDVVIVSENELLPDDHDKTLSVKKKEQQLTRDGFLYMLEAITPTTLNRNVVIGIICRTTGKKTSNTLGDVMPIVDGLVKEFWEKEKEQNQVMTKNARAVWEAIGKEDAITMDRLIARTGKKAGNDVDDLIVAVEAEKNITFDFANEDETSLEHIAPSECRFAGCKTRYYPFVDENGLGNFRAVLTGKETYAVRGFCRRHVVKMLAENKTKCVSFEKAAEFAQKMNDDQ